MSSSPVRWRARWALAQITGVIFSSLVWIVLSAVASQVVAVGLLAGVVFVAVHRTRPVLWLTFGARPAPTADRHIVLRAIVPVASLRGRNQPKVFVANGRRANGWTVWMPGRRTLLVSESLIARMRSDEISDLEVSVLVAHALGQVPVRGSRTVLAVELCCLPWAIVEVVAAQIMPCLSRTPLMSLSWEMRPVVLGLGLSDAVQHARWEAAIPLVVLTVLTYTTGPLELAWGRRLGELGDRRVAAEGIDLAPSPRDELRVVPALTCRELRASDGL